MFNPPPTTPTYAVGVPPLSRNPPVQKTPATPAVAKLDDKVGETNTAAKAHESD